MIKAYARALGTETSAVDFSRGLDESVTGRAGPGASLSAFCLMLFLLDQTFFNDEEPPCACWYAK